MSVSITKNDCIPFQRIQNISECLKKIIFFQKSFNKQKLIYFKNIAVNLLYARDNYTEMGNFNGPNC